MTPTPHAAYADRRAAFHAAADRLGGRADRLGRARVAAFAVAVALAAAALVTRAVPYWAAAVPVALIAALSVWRQGVTRRLARAERGVRLYDRGLDRLADRWPGRGEPGTRYLAADHPFAADLDLFGPGSLFERLNIARTRRGEDRLADWLLRPAAADEVTARQEAVRELAPRVGLREDVALLGAELPGGVDFDGIARWGAGPVLLGGRHWRWGLPTLAALNAVGVLLGVLGLGPLPLLVALLASGAAGLTLRERVRAALAPVEKAERDLGLLAGLLSRLEREEFRGPRLAALAEALRAAGEPPSKQLARLRTLVELLDARRNQFFAPIAPLLLWATQLAFAVEAWRAASGPAVGRWLAAVAEMESLGSLAAYAYERPDDAFPEVAAAGPVFDGEGLGHPLLPADACVRNDVALGGDRRLLLVSGSNMSGKSTLLRTVGVSAVLALAGGPVRARRLRVSPVALGATLRVQDSLLEGKSRFFAEITRVRQLLDLARGPVPLLFLLDEVFHGTNSHDRQVGAAAVVRTLLDAGAVGLVTTHDLALTALADELAPRAVNVHFADQFREGEMSFDYTMRPGVVPHSNALALMRAVGLLTGDQS